MISFFTSGWPPRPRALPLLACPAPRLCWCWLCWPQSTPPTKTCPSSGPSIGLCKCPTGAIHFGLAPNWGVFVFRDRCRTTNNLLGDAYAAAIVEALSKDELAKMDKEREMLEQQEDVESNGQPETKKIMNGRIRSNLSQITKVNTTSFNF